MTTAALYLLVALAVASLVRRARRESIRAENVRADVRNRFLAVAIVLLTTSVASADLLPPDGRGRGPRPPFTRPRPTPTLPTKVPLGPLRPPPVEPEQDDLVPDTSDDSTGFVMLFTVTFIYAGIGALLFVESRKRRLA